MATTVKTSFDYFMANHVNLDKGDTDLARRSRDWLVEQIHLFDGKVADFPVLYSDMDIFYGSFERKTKKRELDDIDLIIVLNAQGSTYYESYDKIEMTVSDNATHLKKYLHDYTSKINSKKIINKLVSSLSNIPQYDKAEIHRQQEAATLNLTSYDWCFDIVPAFFTKPELSGKNYYLIPDGQGHWKKTDPRIDRARVTTINQNHDGNVLAVIILMKYWNKRPTMPSMGSYLLENMILDYYATKPGKASSYVDIEAMNLLGHFCSAIYSPVYDPSGIQGNLNNLAFDEKKKISDRALLDYGKASEALKLETDKNHEASIKKWIEIFGPNFPSFG
jgi:hypothetical protein